MLSSRVQKTSMLTAQALIENVCVLLIQYMNHISICSANGLSNIHKFCIAKVDEVALELQGSYEVSVNNE